MNRNEVTAIAVRFFSIALFISLLRLIIPIATMYLTQDKSLSITSFGIFAVLILLFILVPVLWMFPYTIASIILPKEKVKIEEYKWDNESFLTCGLIILGVYFLFYVISDTVLWLYISNYSDYSRFLTADDKASITATIVEFFLSVFLILGSGGIARIILKIRGRSDF